MSTDFDDLVLEKQWRRCAPAWDKGPEALLEGFIYFCSNYWSIRHPERGKIKLDLREAQIETVDTWLRERYTVVLKARQIGFSTLIATYCFWLTFFYPDRSVVMISRTERESAKLLQKAKYGYRFLPDWLKFRGPLRTENTQSKVSFANESVIESLPSASDPARGEATFLVVVDEIGFLPNSEEAYAAIEPVADVGGRIIMLGTANGEGNLLHSLWVGSQTGTNRYKSIFFPWSAGDRDDEWYAVKKAELPPWQLAQEYPSNPDEAFLRSGNPVFDVDALRAIDTIDPRWRGYLWKPHGKVEFVNDGGSLRVWEMPQSGHVYCIGADVAEGLEHGDYSCAYVIDARENTVVAYFHAHVDADLFGSDILALLGEWYNVALVGVESNNHGLTTLKALKNETKYRNIYRQHRHLSRFEPKTELLGWRTTIASKALAIDELGKELRDVTLHVPDAETIAELRTFVREGNGRMHGSPYDDRTMALAIANQMRRHVWLPEYRVHEKPGPGTMGWWEKKLYPDKTPERVTIGQFSLRK